MAAELDVGDWLPVHGVHVDDDQSQRHGQNVVESRLRPDARHRSAALLGHHVRAPADHQHVDGRHAASHRGPPSALVGCLEVRRGCSLVSQARWVVAPLVLMREDWACDVPRPPESAESCGVASTRRESESQSCTQPQQAHNIGS